MNRFVKVAAALAAATGLVALSACVELAAITEGVLMACEQDPAGCDEVFFSGGPAPAPKPVDPSRW
jgi:hypothetical protein